jgi:inorganic pyrophosphatase
MSDVTDVPEFLLAEIKHFFTVYKDLEPGKGSEIGDWTGVDTAIESIDDARRRFAD